MICCKTEKPSITRLSIISKTKFSVCWQNSKWQFGSDGSRGYWGALNSESFRLNSKYFPHCDSFVCFRSQWGHPGFRSHKWLDSGSLSPPHPRHHLFTNLCSVNMNIQMTADPRPVVKFVYFRISTVSVSSLSFWQVSSDLLRIVLNTNHSQKKIWTKRTQ